MLQQLKSEAIDRLLATPYFGDAPGIPIIDDRTKELDVEIDKALAGIGGLCVFVTTPRASVSPRAVNLTGPYYDAITLFFRVFETPILNAQNNQDGTGKTALETVLQIHATLHLWCPTGAYEPVVASSIALGDDPKRQAWDCVMEHRGGIKLVMPQVATPVISVSDGVVTITCATGGAAIFYTYNGSVPTPLSGILYTGPFPVEGTFTIRTRAWLAGYLGSKEASASASGSFSVIDSETGLASFDSETGRKEVSSDPLL